MESKQLVSIVSQKLSRDQKDINALIEALAATLREKCGNMDSVAIPGFGTFVPIKEEEKISTDLSTGKRILLPPQISLTFQPSVILRKKLLE